MKTTQQLIALLSMILLVTNVYSHGECKNRNDCNWTINEPWMYKAHARVSKLGIPSITNDVDCPYAGGDSYAFAYKDNGCAWQSAANSFGSWTLNGSVYKNTSICARGNSNSQLYYDIVGQNLDYNEYESASISTGSVIYSKSNVSISNINATIHVNGKDLFSSFEIIMWCPKANSGNDSEDKISANNTFWRGKIELLNGRVTLNGNFPANSYTLEKDEKNGGYNLTLKKLTITAQLPTGVNGLSDLIEVVGISDAGVHEDIKINALVDQSQKNNAFDISVSPNPTQDLIKIEYHKNQLQNETFIIKLYDLLGGYIQTISNNNLNSEKGQYLELNLSSFINRSGEYYLLIQNGNNSYLKKIIYQK